MHPICHETSGYGVTHIGLQLKLSNHFLVSCTLFQEHECLRTSIYKFLHLWSNYIVEWNNWYNWPLHHDTNMLHRWMHFLLLINIGRSGYVRLTIGWKGVKRVVSLADADHIPKLRLSSRRTHFRTSKSFCTSIVVSGFRFNHGRVRQIHWICTSSEMSGHRVNILISLKVCSINWSSHNPFTSLSINASLLKLWATKQSSFIVHSVRLHRGNISHT